jgi:TPR repeat protein
MNRIGRVLGCLLLALPVLALGETNSLLVSSEDHCNLNISAEELPLALQDCTRIARNGDADAEYQLGEFYYEGERTPRDLPEALSWLEQASLRGHAQAQYRLGMMFFHGEGVPTNDVQAYVILKMAAINGSDDAIDGADEVAAQMRRDQLQRATQVLGQIFRNYLQEIQVSNNAAPLLPAPSSNDMPN